MTAKHNWKIIRNTILAIGLVVMSIVAGDSHTASAAQTVPTLLNFQGKLVDSTGIPLSDGNYNIRFRAYLNNPTGGTATWTETHDAANRVIVKNGVFSTKLGGITPFSAGDFTAYTIYIEIELPTPGTATCDGVGCSPSWAEGAMTPRQAIAATGYAMNADLVDGIDGASLAQLSANNTFSGSNTFSGTFLQQNTSSTAFRVQNAGGTNALLIDTSSLAVKIGGGDVSPDASPALLVFDYKNTAGDPTGTDGAVYYNSVSGKMRCYEDDLWRDCIGRARTRFEEKDDFMTPYAYNNAAQVNPAFVSGVSGGVVTHIAGETTHPGIIRMSTQNSSTATMGFAMTYDNSAMPILFGSATWMFATVVRVPSASTSGQRFTLYEGFYDNSSSMAPSNGCYFRYVDNQNSGRWQGICRDGGAETGCDPQDATPSSAAAVGGSTWHDLRVRVNSAGSLATFTLNNSAGTYVCTVSANIPTSNKVTVSLGMIKSIGTSPMTSEYDLVEVVGEGLDR